MPAFRSLRAGLALLLTGLLVGPVPAADNVKHIPADADVVVFVNLEQLLSSPLIKKHALPRLEQALKQNKDAQQFISATGLDPLKDLTGVLLTNAGQSEEKVLVVLQGRFDLLLIKNTADAVARQKPEEFKVTQLAGKPLYEAVNKNGQTVYASFPDESHMLVSPSKAYLSQALEAKPGAIDRTLQTAIAEADQKQSIWMASVVSEDARKMLAQQAGPIGEHAAKLKSVTGGITITRDISTAFQMNTSDAAAARALGNFANQAKGLLAFAAASNEEIAPVVNEMLRTLKIMTNAMDVSISFSLSEEVIEKMLESVPKP